MLYCVFYLFFFFFQAEDGIRDRTATGVQTCALPICCSGVNMFSSLDLVIGSPPNPSAVTSGPGFGYGSGPPDGPHYTQIYGSFTSSTTATGSVKIGRASCRERVKVGVGAGE